LFSRLTTCRLDATHAYCGKSRSDPPRQTRGRYASSTLDFTLFARARAYKKAANGAQKSFDAWRTVLAIAGHPPLHADRQNPANSALPEPNKPWPVPAPRFHRPRTIHLYRVRPLRLDEGAGLEGSRQRLACGSQAPGAPRAPGALGFPIRRPLIILLDEGIVLRSQAELKVGIGKFFAVDGNFAGTTRSDMRLCGRLPAASALRRSETPVISPPSHTRMLAPKAVR
jgi:hypothetical protein